MDRRKDDQTTAAPGYGVDIISSADGVALATGFNVRPPDRPWIGIYFECCGVYARVFRRREDQQYEGRCPRCGLSVGVAVGPDGVSARLFRARPQ